MSTQIDKILVSVIIPTYKPGTYLIECLESICQQTIAREKFELIIVLNGCNEPYLSSINSFLAKYQGVIDIHILQTDQPGVSNARNMGIEKAQGEFVCFIDDDDWVSPNYLEELTNTSRGGADIVASNVLCFSDTTGSLSEDYITKAFKRNKATGDIPLLLGRSFMSSSCCKIIRRRKIGNTRFDCNFRTGEDSLFMASISNRAKHLRKSSPEAVYYRRLRMNSASRTTTSLPSRIRSSCHLASAYTRILASDFWHYEWLFFASRYVALLLRVLRGN